MIISKLLSTIMLSFAAFASSVSSADRLNSKINTNEVNINSIDRSVNNNSIYNTLSTSEDPTSPSYVAPYSMYQFGRYYYFNDIFGLYATTSGQGTSSYMYMSATLYKYMTYDGYSYNLYFDFSTISEEHEKVYLRVKEYYKAASTGTYSSDYNIRYFYLKKNCTKDTATIDCNQDVNNQFYISTADYSATVERYVNIGSINRMVGSGYYLEFQISYNSDFSTIDRILNTKQIYDYMIKNEDNVVDANYGFFDVSYSIGYENFKKYFCACAVSCNVSVTGTEFLTDKFKITAAIPSSNYLSSDSTAQYYAGIFLSNTTAFNNAVPLAISTNYISINSFNSTQEFEFAYNSNLVEGTSYIVCIMYENDLTSESIIYNQSIGGQLFFRVNQYTSTGFTMEIPEEVDYQLLAPQVIIEDNNYGYYKFKVVNVNNVGVELFINGESEGSLGALDTLGYYRNFTYNWATSDTSIDYAIKISSDGWIDYTYNLHIDRPTGSTLLAPSVKSVTTTPDYISMTIQNTNQIRVYLIVNGTQYTDILPGSTTIYSYNWLENETSTTINIAFSEYEDTSKVSGSVNYTLSRPTSPAGTEVVNIPELMFMILSLPFTFFSGAFNLTLFAGTAYAINVSDVVLCIFGLLIVIFVVRLVIKIIKMVG